MGRTAGRGAALAGALVPAVAPGHAPGGWREARWPGHGEQRITEHCTQQEEFLVPWESPAIRCAWLSRGISLWCRSCRVRRSRRRRCWNRIHSPMEHCFPFEGCLGRRRQLRWRDDLGHRCDQRWGYRGCGQLWGWGRLRYWRGGYRLGRRPDRCVGGGYRGSCSVLLVHDQGGQYADDGHGGRQKDQQEFSRT